MSSQILPREMIDHPRFIPTGNLGFFPSERSLLPISQFDVILLYRLSLFPFRLGCSIMVIVEGREK